MSSDQVLIETAKILRDTFRNSDISARIGVTSLLSPVGTTETDAIATSVYIKRCAA